MKMVAGDDDVTEDKRRRQASPGQGRSSRKGQSAGSGREGESEGHLKEPLGFLTHRDPELPWHNHCSGRESTGADRVGARGRVGEVKYHEQTTLPRSSDCTREAEQPDSGWKGMCGHGRQGSCKEPTPVSTFSNQKPQFVAGPADT